MKREPLLSSTNAGDSNQSNVVCNLSVDDSLKDVSFCECSLLFREQSRRDAACEAFANMGRWSRYCYSSCWKGELLCEVLEHFLSTAKGLGSAGRETRSKSVSAPADYRSTWKFTTSNVCLSRIARDELCRTCVTSCRLTQKVYVQNNYYTK